MSKVGVIVPIYKIPKTILCQCIESILSQDYTDFQLTLIDDGSPDNCGEICENYALSDERIQVVHQKNRGVAAARNIGLRLSKTEWITFVDPDDWLETTFMSSFIEMATKVDADILISSCYVNYPHRQVTNPFFKDESILGVKSSKDRFILQFLCANIYGDNLCTADSGSPWAKFYKKTFLDKYNLRFNEKLARMEDNVFNLQAYNKAEIIYFENRYLYHYRKSLYSGFSKYTPEIEVYYELFFSILEKHIPKGENESVFLEAIKAKVLNSIYVYCKMKYFNRNRPFRLTEGFYLLNLLLKRPLYSNSIDTMNYSYLSIPEKIFARTLSLRSPILIWLLMKSKELLFQITGKGL